MRRFALLALLPLLAGVASCRQAATSGPLPAKITRVRVGLPPAPLTGDEEAGRRTDPLFKAGHWAPVLVTIEGKGRLDGAELVAQTVDSNDVLNEYAVRLPVLEFTAEQSQFSVMTFARPGKIDSPVTVSLRAGGQTATFPDRTAYALEPNNYLYATLGSRLPGLRLPGMDEKSMRRSEVGAIDRAADLPTRWLGYDTIDLAVLTTGNDEFISALLNDADRRTALVEWVRRGGRLVLAVGAGQNLLQNREDLREFLPVDFGGTVTVESANPRFANTTFDELGDPGKKTPLTVARMTPKPGRDVRVLSSVKSEGGDHPFIVQAPYGLGRVTVLATDPDQPPFTRWKRQSDFWEKMLREAGPIYATARADENLGGFTADASGDNLLGQMQRSLEAFDGVPVISFSWVALFILVYIIIVGPLDYLFLKKVVKRLELTWVTFPLVVLAVSAAAYFTAHALKGDDQKVQKVDLIDFDLQGQTAQGHTWFSIFSPRVQNYTIGVEPAPGWGLKEPVSPPVVTWLGASGARRQSLFRRSYDYDTEAGGLRRVPIQVWSAASFQAAWHYRVDPAAPPLAADLRAVGDQLTGSVVSRLPAELHHAVVFHREQVYDLKTLFPGETRQVITTQRRSFSEWSSQNPGATAVVSQQQPRFGGPAPAGAPEPTDRVVRAAMFHEAFEATLNRTTRNAGFRELDQSWRLSRDDPGDVAVVYGSIPMARPGPAEEVRNNPATVTRLWLGALPGDKDPRPAMTGTMRQETHLRFFVPVKKGE